MASEGAKAPVVDAMAEEGEGTRGYLIALYAARTWATSQKTANTIKWLESLKRKMGQRKVVKQTSNHVFHNTNCEMVNKHGYISPYMATSSNAPQYPSNSHGYNQHPYIWQQPAFQVY